MRPGKPDIQLIAFKASEQDSKLLFPGIGDIVVEVREEPSKNASSRCTPSKWHAIVIGGKKGVLLFITMPDVVDKICLQGVIHGRFL